MAWTLILVSIVLVLDKFMYCSDDNTLIFMAIIGLLIDLFETK